MFRYSIVIPTYQRRELVVANVRALNAQAHRQPFEALVVVDGSTDATAAELRGLDLRFPLTVVEQSNQGAGRARNHGASLAQGEYLLFLDDDVEADPHLLDEHDRSRQAGAEVVLGHLPLHPRSPRNFLARDISAWAEERCRRLSAGGRLRLHDLITPQVSVSRRVFQEAGGFDHSFTAGGTYGNEDLDLLYRLQQAGFPVAFNPAAIGWQQYVVTPRQNFRQYRQAGAADVVLARKYPELAVTLSSRRPEWRIFRRGRTCLRALVLFMLDRGWENGFSSRLFYRVRDLEYWQGVREARSRLRPSE